MPDRTPAPPVPHLAVVGAGPAGLAAVLAAACGVRITLVDAAPQAGGQFHRGHAEALGARRLPAPRLAVARACPAGLGAALAAAARGVRVTLPEGARQAGGQLHRRPAGALGARRPQVLHEARRLREDVEVHDA